VAVTLFFFFGGVLAETRNRSAPPQDGKSNALLITSLSFIGLDNFVLPARS
jgi:hypothetical protein